MNEEVSNNRNYHSVAEVGAMGQLHTACHVFVALLQGNADELQLALECNPENSEIERTVRNPIPEVIWKEPLQ